MLTYPTRRTVTWGLWRYLNYPNAHPIFRRTLRSTTEDKQTTRAIRLMLVFSTLGLCSTLTAAVQAGSTVVVPLVLLVVLFGSSLPATIWAMNISTRLAGERERHTYEPASLPPSGALGMNLAVCAATLHRYDAFGWLNVAHNMVLRLFGFVLVSLVTITAISVGTFEVMVLLRLLLDISALVGAAYMDRVQSIVMACLVGMLTPVYTQQNLPIWSALAFGSLQVTTLVAGALVTIWYTLPLGFVVFYLLREVSIAALWWRLSQALNTDPRHLDVGL